MLTEFERGILIGRSLGKKFGPFINLKKLEFDLGILYEFRHPCPELMPRPSWGRYYSKLPRVIDDYILRIQLDPFEFSDETRYWIGYCVKCKTIFYKKG